MKSDSSNGRFRDTYDVPLIFKEFRPLEYPYGRNSQAAVAQAFAQAVANQQAIEDANRYDTEDDIDSDEILVTDERPTTKLIVDESNMSKKR